MALHKSSQLFGALTLLVVLMWLGWTFKRPDAIQIEPIASQPEQKQDIPAADPPLEDPLIFQNAGLRGTLQHYGVRDISDDAVITYGRISFVASETRSFNSPLLQNVSVDFPVLEPLTSKDTLLDGKSASHQQTIVHIPYIPAPADASNLILGAATNIDRLEDSLDQFSHWASNNDARIIALVPNTSLSTDIDRTAEKAKQLKVKLEILTSGIAFDDRYFHLATLMSERIDSRTEWACFIDDDTFFPSMNNLQAMLSKYASPQKNPYYVGALSEDFHQLFKWGYMAYGGGGVFVSAALLADLRPHLPECAELHHTGDARLAQCIFGHTTTKLSPQTGLYQLDIWGDASGFYEALRPQPLSVHHWKSWHRYDMVNISRVSSVCGDPCIFQKYRFAGTSSESSSQSAYQLTNGFSLVQYSQGNDRDGQDQRMEKTFWDSQGGSWDMFLHSIAPLKARDEEKIQYLLESSITETEGKAESDKVVRQFYVRRKKEEIKEGVDRPRPTLQIVEVAWRKEKRKKGGGTV